MPRKRKSERLVRSAEFAQAAVNAYAELHDVWNGEVNDAETNLIDLLSDLQHWADSEGIDFAAAITMAAYHYDAEVAS
jgi:hypothetical protein